MIHARLSSDSAKVHVLSMYVYLIRFLYQYVSWMLSRKQCYSSGWIGIGIIWENIHVRATKLACFVNGSSLTMCIIFKLILYLI